MAAPIHDHAILGNCRTAALVDRDGCIDWLCWPRFDSPSLLGSLLDPQAGHFRFGLVGGAGRERRYLPDTNVLETHLVCSTGAAVLTDLMPVAGEGDKPRAAMPDHEVLRALECVSGEVDVELELAPRPDYARGRPRIRQVGRLGVCVELPDGVAYLRSDVPVAIGPDGVIRGLLHLRAGQRALASLGFSPSIAVLPPLGEWSLAVIERSMRTWRAWAARVVYDGPARDAVVRSALALKLLLFAPSGAIVAAATTSLPERMSGPYNWDYRYCWLRDAALTARALFGLGFEQEADAFVSWLIHSTALSRPALRVLYDVFGRRPQAERELSHLSGYQGSRPVRIGNAAAAQFQLDIYGEVADAIVQLVRRRQTIDRPTRRLLRDIGTFVARHWREPDAGMWESRLPVAHRTHSRVLCWVALDRLCSLAESGYLPPVRGLAAAREAIRSEVVQRAWNPRLGSYTSELGGDAVDANLLLLPWYGFEPASSERMRATFRRIEAELGAPGGLYVRNRSPETAGEAAFGACGFWAAEFLALGGGVVEEAAVVFESQLAFANDVGLFAEEIDPWSGAALGNFPQAYTHVGLINAALSLSRRLARREEPGHRRTLEWPAPAQTEVRA